jgi:uncharacterized membrane protein
MYTFLVTLHVLGAVLLVGPFALVALFGSRAIRNRDARDTRRAARLTARLAAGSVIVALLGVAALTRSDRYSFRTPWVIMSLTIYVITMGVATGYMIPTIRRAARQLERGKPEHPVAIEGDSHGTDPAPIAPGPARTESVTAPTETDLLAKERLDNIAGRVIGSGTLVFALIVLITILMVVHPFGR